MQDPLAGVLAAGPAAPPSAVACAIAASLAPTRAPDQPPACLDPAQADSFRLLVHRLRADGAVLCAEPTGSGKTYIALAVARALGEGLITCIVPSGLEPQWKETATRLGVDLCLWPHSLLSHGRLPPCDPSLVIVDESQHFRNPGIRRYRTLAPWLIGRRLLLLSATPVVNRPIDLYHQLHLGLRDSVLGIHGAPSLRAAFTRGEVPTALGRFVVQRVELVPAPVARHRTLPAASGAVPFLPEVDRLVLSTHPSVAALIRSVLLAAAASSTRALAGALRRYRFLLLQAQDALATGRQVDRKQLRHLVTGTAEQLQFWSLLPLQEMPGDLALEDLPLLEALLARLAEIGDAPDEKSLALQSLLRDGLPTLVFVTARETIPYLRRVLPDPWVAWCTGQRAGIGTTTLPREAVLQWFRPRRGEAGKLCPGRPRTLVTTDVAAEGLNLQGAGRVVHYDLPWTDVRIGQRNGRAVRRGSRHSQVDVVRVEPAAEIERRLHQAALLTGKSLLPATHGLGPQGKWRWRWRREIADALAGPALNGIAAVLSDTPAALAGIVLERGSRVVDATIFLLEGSATWRADPAGAVRLLECAASGRALAAPDARTVCTILDSLSPSVRDFVRASSELRVSGLQPTPGTLALGRRLRFLAAAAARERNAARLESLDRALRFCNGGHTAGEEMLIAAMATFDDEALLASLPTLPEPSPFPPPVRPRLTGLILFRPDPHTAPPEEAATKAGASCAVPTGA